MVRLRLRRIDVRPDEEVQRIERYLEMDSNR